MFMRGTRVRKALEFFAWEGKVCKEFPLFQGGNLVVVQKENKEIFCFQPGDPSVTVIPDLEETQIL
jgi:hypothetical protein